MYVQQIGTGSPLRLTTDTANDSSPKWAPDGRWIAFLRRQPGGSHDVRLIPPLGGTERKLTEIRLGAESFRQVSLDWCPDSACVLVTDSPGQGQTDALFVVSLESGERRQLTHPQPPFIGTTTRRFLLTPSGSSFAGTLLRSPVSCTVFNWGGT